MTTNASVDAVILDLGGVIVTYDFELGYQRWAELLEVPRELIVAELDYDEVSHRFERGEMTPDEYRLHANRTLGLNLNQEQFVDGWNTIFTGLAEDIDDVIARIARQVRLVVLSNTNQTHADFWKVTYARTLAPTERTFASNEIRARKPEPAAYQTVIDYLQLPAERVAYFDDLLPFVEGGRAVGLRAFQVTATTSIVENLERLGL